MNAPSFNRALQEFCEELSRRHDQTTTISDLQKQLEVLRVRLQDVEARMNDQSDRSKASIRKAKRKTAKYKSQASTLEQQLEQLQDQLGWVRTRRDILQMELADVTLDCSQLTKALQSCNVQRDQAIRDRDTLHGHLACLAS